MNDLTPTRPTEIDPHTEAIARLANAHAAANAFTDYRMRKATNTLARHADDLQTFAQFLAGVGITRDPSALATDPTAWRGITHGLVSAFRAWMLRQNYATGTIGVKLATVKRYAKLAHVAGVIPDDEALRIAAVQGYGGSEARHVDAQRREAGYRTRRSTRKAQANILSAEALKRLRERPATASGKRDAALLALLGGLGLRVSEVVTLKLADVDRETQTLTVHRHKVGLTQKLALRNGVWQAISAWLAMRQGEAPDAALICAVSKGGRITGKPINRISIAERVRAIGEEVGISNLSPHDLRHSWATVAAAKGAPITALRDAGGWRTLAMPAHYVAQAEVANAELVAAMD